MANKPNGRFEDGFLEIVQEQLLSLEEELKGQEESIERLEARVAQQRKVRAETIKGINQLKGLLQSSSNANEDVGGLTTAPAPSVGLMRRPLADADAVVALLLERSLPMHYKDIHREMIARGFEIGGRGNPDTLLSRYFRDPRVARTSRGTYALARKSPTGDAGTREPSLDSTGLPQNLPLVKKIALVLRDAGEPLHYREITKRLLASGAWRTKGKTPDATVNSRLFEEINKNGLRSTFTKTAPGVYGLREWDIVGG